jgi:hypothetical protein
MTTPRNKRAMEQLEWCRANMCTPDGKRVCLLCKLDLSTEGRGALGIFIADAENQKRIGAPSDGERWLIYMVCEGCNELPNRNEQVQDKIFAVVQ